MLQTGGDVDKPWLCSMCDKTFSHRRYLQQHTQGVHLNVRPYECSVCHKCFKKSTHLKDHFRRHLSGDRCRVYRNSLRLARYLLSIVAMQFDMYRITRILLVWKQGYPEVIESWTPDAGYQAEKQLFGCFVEHIKQNQWEKKKTGERLESRSWL